MRRSVHAMVLVAAVAVLAACAVPQPAPIAQTPQAIEATPQGPAQAPATGYPAPPSLASIQPYPGADPRETQQAILQALPTLAPLAEPAPGKGHLTGLIMRESDIRPRESLAGWTLYLAQVQRDVSGRISPVATMQEETAPKAVTDRDGQFAFVNVEPGLYALIIKHPLMLVTARDIRTGQDVVVEITPGAVATEPLIVVTIAD